MQRSAVTAFEIVWQRPSTPKPLSPSTLVRWDSHKTKHDLFFNVNDDVWILGVRRYGLTLLIKHLPTVKSVCICVIRHQRGWSFVQLCQRSLWVWSFGPGWDTGRWKWWDISRICILVLSEPCWMCGCLYVQWTPSLVCTQWVSWSRRPRIIRSLSLASLTVLYPSWTWTPLCPESSGHDGEFTFPVTPS